MSKINSMMDVGKRSLMNSQTALQTTGHNIASKGVEGFSRQRVEQVTNVPVGEGVLRIGMGAKAAAVTRVNNPYLEKQLGKEQAQLGYLDGKQGAMSRVESVYNEQTNRGLNQFIGDFFNAFRELSNNPESSASRALVKESGDFLTKDFKRISKQLTEIQRDLDQQVATNVNEVNGITTEIADLNQKVQSVELTGAAANDERDRRDLLLKKLGEKINIRWAEGTDGMVTVSAGSSALLVSGYDAKQLVASPTGETAHKDEGGFDVFYLSNERAVPVKVTDQLTGGSLGGVLEVRDSIITGLKNDVDMMAYNLADSINELHQGGVNLYGETGVDFFKEPSQVRHAAEMLAVNEDILHDSSKIAAAARDNAPGDNRVANQISNLQYEKILSDGQSTLDDFYDGMVGRVGIMTRKTNVAHDSQKEIVKQLSNIRESISGVSLDEETTKMIEFQKAFDASARLIKTADEMFDTVLKLKPM